MDGEEDPVSRIRERSSPSLPGKIPTALIFGLLVTYEFKNQISLSRAVALACFVARARCIHSIDFPTIFFGECSQTSNLKN